MDEHPVNMTSESQQSQQSQRRVEVLEQAALAMELIEKTGAAPVLGSDPVSWAITSRASCSLTSSFFPFSFFSFFFFFFGFLAD